jgi:hypothetical protein
MNYLLTIEEIRKLNTSGITVIYISDNGSWHNIYKADKIYWEPHQAALTMARNSKFFKDNINIFIVDNNKDLAGFYCFNGTNDRHVILSQVWSFNFRKATTSTKKTPR